MQATFPKGSRSQERGIVRLRHVTCELGQQGQEGALPPSLPCGEGLTVGVELTGGALQSLRDREEQGWIPHLHVPTGLEVGFSGSRKGTLLSFYAVFSSDIFYKKVTRI